MAVLNEEEKVRVRYHTGYLNVSAVQTFALGTPASVETQFIIEGAMNKILESALPLVRELIQKCDSTRQQMFEQQENIQVTKLGELVINSTGIDRGQMQLREVYFDWVNQLCNAMGVKQNPYRADTLGQSGGGINVGVA